MTLVQPSLKADIMLLVSLPQAMITAINLGQVLTAAVPHPLSGAHCQLQNTFSSPAIS